MSQVIHKPRRFVLTPWLRLVNSGTGELYRYPMCTATPEGYTFPAPVRIDKLSVSAILTNFVGTDTFSVGLYKDTFSSAFMEVSIDPDDAAYGDYFATDTTTVTEFDTTEEFLIRVYVQSGKCENVTIMVDGEWLG